MAIVIMAIVQSSADIGSPILTLGPQSASITGTPMRYNEQSLAFHDIVVNTYMYYKRHTSAEQAYVADSERYRVYSKKKGIG